MANNRPLLLLIAIINIHTFFMDVAPVISFFVFFSSGYGLFKSTSLKESLNQSRQRTLKGLQRSHRKYRSSYKYENKKKFYHILVFDQPSMFPHSCEG